MLIQTWNMKNIKLELTRLLSIEDKLKRYALKKLVRTDMSPCESWLKVNSEFRDDEEPPSTVEDSAKKKLNMIIKSYWHHSKVKPSKVENKISSREKDYKDFD